MGIEKVLLGINNYQKELSILNLVEKSKRNIEWHEKVQSLSNSYKNELNQIQFGKFITKSNKDSKINNVEYMNLKLNQKLLIEREKHPVIYFLDNGKIIFFITKTSSAAKFKIPTKDCMEGTTIVKDYVTVSNLLNSNNAYLSNAIYIIELKDNSELNNVLVNIEDDELNMDKYFSNKHLRLVQKEQAFELLYRSILKNQPDDFSTDFSINKNVENTFLVDVTFDKYIIDNIDRISNYENYRKDSWMEYLKLYEVDEINNKNDPTDI